jgi:hypothetical protein
VNVEPAVRSVLTRPGTLVFHSNQRFAQDFDAARGRVVRRPSGHWVFYGPEGRRMLMTDPDGHPLHECEWEGEGPRTKMARARVFLDWGRWVGVKPGGMVNSTRLDLSTKPGWQRLTRDDLRRMAARAVGVPLEEIRFFYRDSDLLLSDRGEATITHRKDALYVLDDGAFETARFMACMGAMHWERIDFLPVVELFQSLLPGTGSAVMELIRGLYDDQQEAAPRPLFYRGIPPYPSEAAFGLFGQFFDAAASGGVGPCSLFMDPARSHQVRWTPTADPPRRYVDPARHLCVTIKGRTVVKVTKDDDPSGLPFVPAGNNGFVPCERQVAVAKGQVELRDRDVRLTVPPSAAWGPLDDTGETSSPPRAAGWKHLFDDGSPRVAPAEAYAAVLLYPEDAREIDEAASQPFAADHLQDAWEQRPDRRTTLARADRVLIDDFDTALSACVSLDRPRDYVVLYRRPAFAQRHAQLLWNQLVRADHLDWVSRFSFRRAETARPGAYAQSYDAIYRWLPFAIHDRPDEWETAARSVAGALRTGGLAFLVGPDAFRRILPSCRLRLLEAEAVESLPSFRMHRTILPQARLKPGLTLFVVIAGTPAPP